MPAPYTSGQSSYPRRYRTCWASSQMSHTASFTACYEVSSCSTHLPPVHRVGTLGITNQETHFYQPHNNSSVHLTAATKCGALGGSPKECGLECLESNTKLRTFIPDFGTHLPGMALPRTKWVRLNCLRAGIGRFRFCLHKWGMAPSAACECGAEEQTVDHVILHRLIHRIYPMRDCMACRFWTMRQSNGCSTPAPRSSAG